MNENIHISYTSFSKIAGLSAWLITMTFYILRIISLDFSIRDVIALVAGLCFSVVIYGLLFQGYILTRDRLVGIMKPQWLYRRMPEGFQRGDNISIELRDGGFVFGKAIVVLNHDKEDYFHIPLTMKNSNKLVSRLVEWDAIVSPDVIEAIGSSSRASE